MNAEILVPYKPSPGRAKAWEQTRAHLEQLPWPYVLARDRHRPFRRAQALNMAVAASDAAIIVINDADSVVTAGQIQEAITLAHTPGLVFAYTRYVRLDEHGHVDRVLQEPSSHGCVAIRRDCFAEIGGYDERYRGWGPEDQEFNRRAANLWPLRRVPGDLTHLWHGERRNDDSPLDTPAEMVERNWHI